jgi:hypothetical protein
LGAEAQTMNVTRIAVQFSRGENRRLHPKARPAFPQP